MSEIETTYTFQKTEPLIDWKGVTNANVADNGGRSVVYSAIQKSVVDKLAEKFTEIGAKLVCVDNSLSCTFRALEYIGATEAQMQQYVTWNLLIINSLGYTLASMSGKNVVQFEEEPLPLKTFEEEEIYDEIVQSVQLVLSNNPANYLYVISDTDLVSAEILVSRLDVMGTVDFIENNSLKTEDSIIPVSTDVPQEYASKISLQAIGCALADTSTFPLSFNYVAHSDLFVDEPSCTIPIGEHEYTITKSQAMKLAGIIAGILIVLFVGLGYGVIPALKNSNEKKAQDITAKLEEANAELKILKGDGDLANFDLKREVEMGVKANRAKLMNFVAPGENIPEDVWLTYFMTQGNGLVDIKGESSDVGSVYTFFKSMRDSLNSTGSKLKLQNLEMTSKSVDAAVSGAGAYTFEITNMTSEELNNLNNPDKVSNNGDNGSNKSKSSNESVPENSDLLGDQPID